MRCSRGQSCIPAAEMRGCSLLIVAPSTCVLISPVSDIGSSPDKLYLIGCIPGGFISTKHDDKLRGRSKGKPHFRYVFSIENIRAPHFSSYVWDWHSEICRRKSSIVDRGPIRVGRHASRGRTGEPIEYQCERLTRTISIVGVHCAGEVGGVIVGGVLNPPHCKTMYEKLLYFQNKADDIRQLLMSEPRGRPAMCMNLVLPPCDPCADAGLLIMESDEYPPMSGGNTISTATVLLDTGMVKMTEPVTKLNLETPAGLVSVTADCEDGKCKGWRLTMCLLLCTSLICRWMFPGWV